MAVIHISEEEAAGLGPILAKVRAGEEVVIDSGDGSFAVTRIPVSTSMPAVQPQHRTLSEALRRAEERNSKLTLDDQFGNDLEAIILQHQQEVRFDPWE